MDAQKAQIRTASLAIGIEPKSASNGGDVRGSRWRSGYRATAIGEVRHADGLTARQQPAGRAGGTCAMDN